MTHASHGEHLIGRLDGDDEQGRRDAEAERRFMLEHHRTDGWIASRLDDAAGTLVDATVAHVLAERVRPTPGSELAEFLVYDILRPTAVLAELEAARGSIRSDWFEALHAFVADAADRGFPVGHTGPEARPMLYVTRATTPQGVWVDATTDDRTLLEQLLNLPGDPADRRWTVRARMGFYDVYPLTTPEIWIMNHVAQGISRHGEAYAAYAEYSMQQGMSELDFLSRYRGFAPTLDHFVFDHAEREGWLAAVTTANEQIGFMGALSLDIEAVREHLFCNGFAYEPGRAGYHVFGPPAL